ncbi:MAG: 16S rRNA (cytosine(1402)-N(4))-methyltransferase RsmH [Alphaproteobacteria bacterium]|nr:16S rRNA (cytosine(1402)-N(4))-methyltransferase RsmH [Alphaproteobacteria bacterium]MBL0717861.1 16S rRNA (cytosine(1402)-N(4))-methyltransferase RsmH [Alphaproteobacteria bacterium]
MISNLNLTHKPVLIKSIMRLLDDTWKIEDWSEKVVVDATFGAGGYSNAFIGRGAKVFAFDQDKSIQKFVQDTRKIVSDRKSVDKFEFICDNFVNIDKYKQIENVDLVIFDLGMSSMQLDSEDRGFSFRFDDSPLDMDMSDSKLDDKSAEYILNNYTKKQLADAFFNYGGEKASYKIADSIIESRPLTTVADLKTAVQVVSKHPKSITRIFQAIRIEVNDEINNLWIALNNSVKILGKNGIVLVVDFHSVEDKYVKFFFKNNKELKPLFKKIMVPDDEEIRHNPRARSAKLRGAIMVNK